MGHMTQTCLSDILKTQGEITSELIESILNAPQEGTFFHKYQQSATMGAKMRRDKVQTYKECRKNFACSETYNPYLYNESDTSSGGEKVTLSMEVRHSDHIEMQTNRMQLKLDDSISKIIADTKIDIIFPDKEDHEQRYGYKNELTQFSNQILIHGSLKEVNEARKRLRKLTPLMVSFSTKGCKESVNKETIKECIKELQEDGHLKSVNVQLTSYSQDSSEPTIHVTGRIGNATNIATVCESLKKALFDEHNCEKVIFSSCLEMPSCQWDLIIAKQQPEYFFIAVASKITNADIHFPEKIDRHMVSFFCTGTSPISVIEARRVLQSLLPLQLCVDVTNDDLVEPLNFGPLRSKQEFDSENLVTINYYKSEYEMEPLLATEPMRHFVHFVTQEFNVTGLFASLASTFTHARFVAAISLDSTDYNGISSRLMTTACKNYVGHMPMIKSMAAPNALLLETEEPSANIVRDESLAEYEPARVLREISANVPHSSHMGEQVSRLMQQGGLIARYYPLHYSASFPRSPYSANAFQCRDDSNNTNQTNTPNGSTNVSFSSTRSQSRVRNSNYSTGNQSYNKNTANETHERRAPVYSNVTYPDKTQGPRSYVSSTRGGGRGRWPYGGKAYHHNDRNTHMSHADFGNVEYLRQYENSQRHRGIHGNHYLQNEHQEQQFDKAPKSKARYHDDYTNRQYRDDRCYQRDSPLKDQSNPKRTSFSDVDGHTTNKSIEPLELIRVASTEPQSLEHSREMIEHRGYEFSASDGSVDEANRHSHVATYAQILEGKKPANGVESK
ncbi:unnamed protein product, partial [Mesorhabditis belari]|uniref:Defective in germ line development protein 3-like KH5 domain-containing protein n=1 Tax=Mesorhabditis belari TaxID=2138241 RepID=A0AAF3EN13_9BILA